MTSIQTKNLRLQYGERIIADNINVSFDKPEIISIIGPNGSGKSTLLKSFSKLLIPSSGTVYLNGKDLQQIAMNDLAQVISVLPQSAQAPGDMTVRDLVTYGRMPYQKLFSNLTEEDNNAIDSAIESTDMTKLQNNRLDNLSGGERQRAWLAMALAKEPKILLLDEPTTYLDIHHQLNLMELVVHLHKTMNITVIMVLHDLNHAARYSQRLIAVKGGEIVADGSVESVFCCKVLEPLYDIRAVVTSVTENKQEYLTCFPYAAVEY